MHEFINSIGTLEFYYILKLLIFSIIHITILEIKIIYIEIKYLLLLIINYIVYLLFNQN